MHTHCALWSPGCIRWCREMLVSPSKMRFRWEITSSPKRWGTCQTRHKSWNVHLLTGKRSVLAVLTEDWLFSVVVIHPATFSLMTQTQPDESQCYFVRGMSSLTDAVPPVPLQCVLWWEYFPWPPHLHAGALAARSRQVQAAPVRLGAFRFWNPGLSGQTRGGAGDVPPPVKGNKGFIKDLPSLLSIISGHYLCFFCGLRNAKCKWTWWSSIFSCLYGAVLWQQQAKQPEVQMDLWKQPEIWVCVSCV